MDKINYSSTSGDLPKYIELPLDTSWMDTSISSTSSGSWSTSTSTASDFDYYYSSNEDWMGTLKDYLNMAPSEEMIKKVFAILGFKVNQEEIDYVISHWNSFDENNEKKEAE